MGIKSDIQYNGPNKHSDWTARATATSNPQWPSNEALAIKAHERDLKIDQNAPLYRQRAHECLTQDRFLFEVSPTEGKVELTCKLEVFPQASEGNAGRNSTSRII